MRSLLSRCVAVVVVYGLISAVGLAVLRVRQELVPDARLEVPSVTVPDPASNTPARNP